MTKQRRKRGTFTLDDEAGTSMLLYRLSPRAGHPLKHEDQQKGSILYVGKSGNLLGRLGPSDHGMWYALYKTEVLPPQEIVDKIQIAIWREPSVHVAECGESQLIAAMFPRFNSQDGADINPAVWKFREPDHIVPHQSFSKRLRKTKGFSFPPFRSNTTGIYAWVLPPSDNQGNWLSRLIVTGDGNAPSPFNISDWKQIWQFNFDGGKLNYCAPFVDVTAIIHLGQDDAMTVCGRKLMHSTQESWTIKGHVEETSCKDCLDCSKRGVYRTQPPDVENVRTV